jgi:DNA ligase (NAD+)
MTELETKLLTYNKLYRTGKPVISDKEYDDLFATLPPDSVLLKSGVIDEVPSERKSPLPIPMFSMDKIKSVKELKDWINSLSLPSDTTFVITGKYDGISLCVNEENRKACTRGDGYIGQDSSKHYENMLSGSSCSSFNHTFGEAIMPLELFSSYKDEYSNTRNLVGGLLNTSKINSALQDVVYMKYGCDNSEMDKVDILDALNKTNPFSVIFSTIDSLAFDVYNDEALEEMFDQFYQSISKTFLLDGVIIEVDDANLRKQLGREKNNNPAYARAIKLERWQKGDTVDVIGVNLEVSKQAV